MVIVETADAVLVAPKAKVQDVKKLVARIKAAGRSEHVSHAVPASGQGKDLSDAICPPSRPTTCAAAFPMKSTPELVYQVGPRVRGVHEAEARVRGPRHPPHQRAIRHKS